MKVNWEKLKIAMFLPNYDVVLSENWFGCRIDENYIPFYDNGSVVVVLVMDEEEYNRVVHEDPATPRNFSIEMTYEEAMALLAGFEVRFNNGFILYREDDDD